MRDREPLLSRRALLAAGVGGVALVAGCTDGSPRPIVDPDVAALEVARAGERALLAGYAEGTEGHSVHLAHLRALGGATPTAGTSPTPGPSSSPGAAAPEGATVAPLMAAARTAHRGDTAALLAGIAASHAVFSSARPR